MNMAAGASERRRVDLTARRTQRASRVYGQFVGLMKVILPTIATALLLVVVIVVFLAVVVPLVVVIIVVVVVVEIVVVLVVLVLGLL